MTTENPVRLAIRALHRDGTDDAATAVAMVRAAHRQDWPALLRIGRDLRTSTDDDLLGVALWCAQVAAVGLTVEPDAADAFLDSCAQHEAEHHG